jgi:fatty-acyl-CoA synthase
MANGADYLVMQSRLQPHRLAACDLATGKSWSYAVFERAVGQYAAALQARGVRHGDRVAILAKNCVAIILVHFACARLGAMIVPLNWRLARSEITALLADCEPRLIFGDALLAAFGIEGVGLDDFAAEAAHASPIGPQNYDDEAPSVMLYTSGTSGLPKGVLLSERNLWATGQNFSLLGRVTHQSVVLCDAPMFHVIGLVTNIRPALMRGGAALISDGFAPGRTLTRLCDPGLRISHYFCVPQMAAALWGAPEYNGAALRQLTAIFSGGAPHATEAIRRWTRDGIAMADGFGMTEAGTISCMPLDPDVIDAKAGSAGIIAPGVELQIMDGLGRLCPPGEAGEIFVRGASVTSGYWRRKAANEAAFEGDGWLRSGDIGRLDADGYLWLIDRKKDMYISGGENVYPAEIESALAAFPDLADCAVVGVGDERWGEVGHLAIVPQDGRTIEPAAVLAYLEARLARYKLPRHITIMPVLPRNGAGKLVKAQLRAVLAPPLSSADIGMQES